jgi:hypothetical protein
MSDDWYRAWIERRRTAAPPTDMADRVMRAVMEVEAAQKQILALRFVSWIERSRAARYVACGTAMLIGSAPMAAFFAYLLLV